MCNFEIISHNFCVKEIIAYYENRITEYRKEETKHNRAINIYSFLRLAAVLFWGFAIYYSLQLEKVWATELAFLLPIFLFAFFVGEQSKYQNLKQYAAHIIGINQNELKSISNHDNVYDDGKRFRNDQHLYSSDLDVFGKRSLFQLLNRCATGFGNLLLASWLQKGGDRLEIQARQLAVKDLSAKSGWKQHFQAVLFFNNKLEDDSIPKVIAYLKMPATNLSPLLLLYVKWLPFIIIPLLIGSFFFTKTIIVVALLVLVNLFIVQVTGSVVEKTEVLVGKTGLALSKYAEAIKAVENEQWESALCDDLALILRGGDGKSMALKIKELAKHVSLLELCGAAFIGFLLKSTLLLNVRQYLAIEKWRQLNHQRIAEIFDVIASFEALVSLSSLHSNYPEWCFPSITDDCNYTYNVKGAGHPLIAKESRVTNDYTLNNTLKIDIITGSNMAGKSTFLRTLGINAVLALCGAPVCAQEMTISCMTLFTYMRIKDSLNESTSTFKAELDRLRLLLDTLKQESKVFFLIDEMLRGTNSVDKYRGSKAIIEKLISQQSVGAVATHDLQIAELEVKYPDYIRNFYFDIQVVNEEMLFDYKLKAGECKTFNASLLLKKLGIEVE